VLLIEPNCSSADRRSIFPISFPSKIFSSAKFEKSATNSDDFFIISSFTANSENQWVVFYSPYRISIQPDSALDHITIENRRLKTE